MREEGERVAYEANVPGLHPDLIKLLGRLKFRTSYGQNVLAHSLEVSMIAAALAAEIGADINVCKTAGLLHDIGKAVDREVEGPHALIGADIAKPAGPVGRRSSMRSPLTTARKSRRPSRRSSWPRPTRSAGPGQVLAARWSRPTSSDSRRWKASRTRSTASRSRLPSRPGAKSGSWSRRTMIDDLASARLARDIAKKIEESLEYPGQIKVTVIRETRVVDYAR